MTHGVGLFFILLSGFGLLARLGMTTGLPGWIILKLVIWLLLGGMLVLVHKFQNKAKLWWFIILLLGFSAAYVAVLKPTL